MCKYCKYCNNEVTEDSRLAFMGVCVECAAADEEGNRLQVEMAKDEAFDLFSSLSFLPTVEPKPILDPLCGWVGVIGR
jgi:hypothetical protein